MRRVVPSGVAVKEVRPTSKFLKRLSRVLLPSEEAFETLIQSDHSRCHCLLLYYRINCADSPNRRTSHSANRDHHSWTVQLPHVDITADSASGTRNMPVRPSSTRLLSPVAAALPSKVPHTWRPKPRANLGTSTAAGPSTSAACHRGGFPADNFIFSRGAEGESCERGEVPNPHPTKSHSVHY
jgi:hypothetical protein